MNKIVVLGAGMVGKAMAIDLAKSYDVTCVDINEEALGSLQVLGIKTVKADLTVVNNMAGIISKFDLVIGAVPGSMGWQTALTTAECGKNMVDISFFPEDPFELDEFARKNNVTVVTDCGVSPGMSNIILGYHNQHMKVQSYECLVGGLPLVREWPFQYKAVFSPIDVIEEYIRPARFVQNGSMITREALSDPELVNIEGVGTLEAWNSDGLRTLIETMPNIPNMIEKTMRYPGCIEYLRVLRETGFFSYDPIEVKGMKVRPIDVTAKLLFPIWKLKPGEEEFVAMRIKIRGTENDKEKSYEYNLLDRTDKTSGTISMARATGYTGTAVANLIAKGKFARKGICAPEYIGESEEHFHFVMNYLKERGVHYSVKSE